MLATREMINGTSSHRVFGAESLRRLGAAELIGRPVHAGAARPHVRRLGGPRPLGGRRHRPGPADADAAGGAHPRPHPRPPRLPRRRVRDHVRGRPRAPAHHALDRLRARGQPDGAARLPQLAGPDARAARRPAAARPRPGHRQHPRAGERAAGPPRRPAGRDARRGAGGPRHPVRGGQGDQVDQAAAPVRRPRPVRQIQAVNETAAHLEVLLVRGQVTRATRRQAPTSTRLLRPRGSRGLSRAVGTGRPR